MFKRTKHPPAEAAPKTLPVSRQGAPALPPIRNPEENCDPSNSGNHQDVSDFAAAVANAATMVKGIQSKTLKAEEIQNSVEQIPRLGSVIRINLVLLIKQMRLRKTNQLISSTVAKINLTKIKLVMIEKATKVIRLVQKITSIKFVQVKSLKLVRNNVKMINLVKINIFKNKVMKVHSLLVNPVLSANLVKENKMTQRKLAKIKIVKVVLNFQSITIFNGKLNRRMTQRMTELART
jgi:hypothetical protein